MSRNTYYHAPTSSCFKKVYQGNYKRIKTLSEVRFIGSFAEKNSSEYQVSTPHGHPEYFAKLGKKQ